VSTYSVKPITGISDVIQLSKITYPTGDTSVAIQGNMVCCETLLEVHMNLRNHFNILFVKEFINDWEACGGIRNLSIAIVLYDVM